VSSERKKESEEKELHLGKRRYGVSTEIIEGGGGGVAEKISNG